MKIYLICISIILSFGACSGVKIRRADDSGLILTEKGGGVWWSQQDLPLIPMLIIPKDNPYRIHITMAIRELNRHIGCTIITEPTDWILDSSVLVPANLGVFLIETTDKLTNSALTSFRYDKRSGRMISAIVTLPNKWGPSVLGGRFTVHEIGHVLGLAHDKRLDSIMRPFLMDSDDRNLTLTKEDREMLNRMYCN